MYQLSIQVTLEGLSSEHLPKQAGNIPNYKELTTHRPIELDIDALDVDPPSGRTAAAVHRLSSASRELQPNAARGLVLNRGWLLDPIMLWRGGAERRLPISSRRLDSWSRLTYADLRRLIADLRVEALSRGALHQERGDWVRRQLQLFPFQSRT